MSATLDSRSDQCHLTAEVAVDLKTLSSKTQDFFLNVNVSRWESTQPFHIPILSATSPLIAFGDNFMSPGVIATCITFTYRIYLPAALFVPCYLIFLFCFVVSCYIRPIQKLKIDLRQASERGTHLRKMRNTSNGALPITLQSDALTFGHWLTFFASYGERLAVVLQEHFLRPKVNAPWSHPSLLTWLFQEEVAATVTRPMIPLWLFLLQVLLATLTATTKYFVSHF